MTDYTRAITELSTLVQPGDVLTLLCGDRDMSAGHPTNPAAYRGGLHWLVSIKTSWGFCPVDLHAITAVERGGVCIWSITGERAPVQMKLFQEAG